MYTTLLISCRETIFSKEMITFRLKRCVVASVDGMNENSRQTH